jgi:hypothetical protein
MASSGMLRRVAIVRTDVSVERSTTIIKVTRIGELGTLAVTIPQDAILHIHLREDLSLTFLPVSLPAKLCMDRQRKDVIIFATLGTGRNRSSVLPLVQGCLSSNN